MSIDVNIIRSSFDKAKPIGHQVVDKFYKILFSDYPQAKPLFAKANMEVQKKSLLNSLVFIVDHLEDEKRLYDYLFKMGQRHVPYGAEEEHYDWVGASLLKTFAYFFKEDWTEELHAQWTIAFEAIKSMMLEGQKSVMLKSQDLRAQASEICSTLLLEVLDQEISEEFIEVTRSKVREVLQSCLEEEGRKLLKKAS